MNDFGEVNIPEATEIPKAEPVPPVNMEQVNRKDGIGVNHDGSLTYNGFGSKSQGNINKYGETIGSSAQEESTSTNTSSNNQTITRNLPNYTPQQPQHTTEGRGPKYKNMGSRSPSRPREKWDTNNGMSDNGYRNPANRSNSYYGPTKAYKEGITRFFENKDQILKASEELQAQTPAEKTTQQTQEHINRTEEKHQQRMEETKKYAESTLEDLKNELARIKEQNVSQHPTVEQQKQKVINQINNNTPDRTLNGEKKEFIGGDIRFNTKGGDAEQRLKELLGGEVQNPSKNKDETNNKTLSTVPNRNSVLPKTQEEKDREILQELDPLKKDSNINRRTLTTREKRYVNKAVNNIINEGQKDSQIDKSNVKDLVQSAIERANMESSSRLATEEEMNNLNKLEEERIRHIQEINNQYAREKAEKRIDEDLAELRKTLNHQVALDKNEDLNDGFNPLKPMSQKGQDFFERNYGNNPPSIDQQMAESTSTQTNENFDPMAETIQDATTQEPTPSNNPNGIPVRNGNYITQNMFGNREPLIDNTTPIQPTDPEKRPDEIEIESYDPQAPEINPEIPPRDPNDGPEQDPNVIPEVQALKDEIDLLKEQIEKLTDLLNDITDPTISESDDENPEVTPSSPNTQEQTEEETPDLPESGESEFIDADYYDVEEADDERINVPETGPQNRNMKRNKLIAGVIGGAAGFGTALAVGTGAAPVIGGVMTAATATTFGVKLISKARIDRLGQKMRESTDPEERQKFEKRLNRWQKVSKGAELAKSFLIGAGIGLFAGTFVSGTFFGGEGLIDKFTQTPDVTPTVSGYDQGATSYADKRINPDGTIPGGNTRWEPSVEQITPNTPEVPNIELPASEQLVVDGRVNLPGSAWNGNLGGDPTGTLPGGELNFSNYLGSDTQMAANMLNKDLVDAGIKMSELTDKLTTPGVHRLLNGYLDAARAGVNPELTDVLGQMSNPAAKDIISMLNPN